MTAHSETIDLPPERPGRPAPEDLAARRAMIGMAPSRFPPVPGVTVSEERLGGVRALRIRADGRPPRGTIVHLHGGGYRLGAPEAAVGLGSILAGRLGFQVIAPAYRLAPEHPFPAGLADALAAVSALSEAEKAQLVLSGDSAGGGLAASLTRLVLARGVQPRGLMLFAPWLDLRVTNRSYEENAGRDALFTKESASTAADQYLQGWPASDPLASALFGPVADYPPTLIVVSEHEVLRDDSIAYAEHLKAGGRPVELHRIPDMEHVALNRDPTLTGSPESLDAVLAYLQRIA